MSNLKLTTCERALFCKRLRDSGVSPQAIAEKARLSRSHVSYLLSLASAPEPIFNMVKDGQVSGQLAVKIVRQFGDKAHEVLLGLLSGQDDVARLNRTEALENQLLELAQKYSLQESTTESPVEDKEQGSC